MNGDRQEERKITTMIDRVVIVLVSVLLLQVYCLAFNDAHSRDLWLQKIRYCGNSHLQCHPHPSIIKMDYRGVDRWLRVMKTEGWRSRRGEERKMELGGGRREEEKNLVG